MILSVQSSNLALALNGQTGRSNHATGFETNTTKSSDYSQQRNVVGCHKTTLNYNRQKIDTLRIIEIKTKEALNF